MIFNQLADKKVSMLGFGTMRLPTKEDKSIDEDTVRKMVALAMENGVNYFDTAYPYHGGNSERVIGKILSEYPRDSFYLATKYPGHQISERYDPAEIFEEQLQKCGVDYFDFYLLHNVCENSMSVYEDARWGIIDYFCEQRAKGRIKHLGFSSHARPENLRCFLDKYGDKMEFCQIQLNYLDWSLQNASAKYFLLTHRNIPIIVMEPVHGGRLAHPDGKAAQVLRQISSDDTPASLAFRWLQGLPGISVVLSGMSDFAQMEENIRTFDKSSPLSDIETQFIFSAAEHMKNSLPCTGCRYCTEGCPMGLDIPMLIAAYNDTRYEKGMTVSMQMDALSPDKLPSACIGCGACSAICPQKIDIPKAMKDFSELIPTLPNWKALCEQRAKEAAEGRKK